MPKKRKNEEVLNSFDPGIEKLATERLLSGKQLFDYKTHKLRRHIRDEMQARAILLRAQDLAKQWSKKLVLRYFEKRLLNQAFEDEIVLLLIAVLFGCCMLSSTLDECDGIQDEFELTHVPFEISDSVNSNHKYYFRTNVYDFRTNLYEMRTKSYEMRTVSGATDIA